MLPAAAVLAVSCAPAAPPEPVTRPNIILISIDTLRADRLGVYGYQRPTSPYLDALAATGVHFSDVITPSTSTRLAHRAILRGTLAVAGTGSTPTLAEILQGQGYRTGAVVDGGFMRARFGHADGFDTYVDDLTPQAGGGGRPVADQHGGGFQVVLPRAETWLRQQGKVPWFLFLHTYDVHCPYEPPEEDAVIFTGGRPPAADLSGLCGKTGLREMSLDEEGLDWLRDLYDGGIHHADRLLGEFMTRAAAAGYLDNTLVAVISDHGESLGEHGWIGHNRLYREQMQVPWILAGPGVPAGGAVTGPVHLADLVPTLLDYAGLPRPEKIAGRSLREVVAGGAPLPAQRLRVTESQHARALVRGPWMVITDSRGEKILQSGRLDDRATAAGAAGPPPQLASDLMSAWEDLARRLEVDVANLEDAEIPEAGAVREELRTLGYVD